MLHDDAYIARPIDGRAPYTKAAFVTMLRSLIRAVNPNYIRTQSSIGHRDPLPNVDHVDHTAGAILAAEADTNSQGETWIRRDEYLGYVIRDGAYGENVTGYWRDEKTAIWDQYWPHDPELGPGAWYGVMGKQHRPLDRIFWPGEPWIPPDDFDDC
jgi:hypothetical protein